jgi:hypothetical protein
MRPAMLADYFGTKYSNVNGAWFVQTLGAFFPWLVGWLVV